MNSINIEIVAKHPHLLPRYEHVGDAGMDVRAYITEDNYPEHDIYSSEDGFTLPCIILQAGKTKLIPTGNYVAIPLGYEIQIRPRSGMALKKSITILNTPGTIDHQYRGEISVILHNAGDTSIVIKNGDKIAQMVLSEVPRILWSKVVELGSTLRGTGGFGSTGEQ